MRAGADEIAAERIDEPAADERQRLSERERLASGVDLLVDLIVLVFSDRDRQAGGAFGRGAFGVEGEEPREHLVLEFGRPDRGACFRFLALVGLCRGISGAARAARSCQP